MGSPRGAERNPSKQRRLQTRPKSSEFRGVKRERFLNVFEESPNQLGIIPERGKTHYAELGIRAIGLVLE
jgi:hypothetical protein